MRVRTSFAHSVPNAHPLQPVCHGRRQAKWSEATSAGARCQKANLHARAQEPRARGEKTAPRRQLLSPSLPRSCGASVSSGLGRPAGFSCAQAARAASGAEKAGICQGQQRLWRKRTTHSRLVGPSVTGPELESEEGGQAEPRRGDPSGRWLCCLTGARGARLFQAPEPRTGQAGKGLPWPPLAPTPRGRGSHISIRSWHPGHTQRLVLLIRLLAEMTHQGASQRLARDPLCHLLKGEPPGQEGRVSGPSAVHRREPVQRPPGRPSRDEGT